MQAHGYLLDGRWRRRRVVLAKPRWNLAFGAHSLHVFVSRIQKTLSKHDTHRLFAFHGGPVRYRQ